MIKWGILGCGKIAAKFASDMALSKTGFIYACASKDMERSKQFGQKFQVTHVFTSYEEMLRLDELDAIYIATPHSHHFEHTILCLQARKNVLCEKPLTINKGMANALFKLAEQNKCFLMEGMWTAFLPMIQEIQWKIQNGEIGEIRHIQADFGFRTTYNPTSRLYDPRLAGGALLDIGIYPIYICLSLLGIPHEIIAKGNLTDQNIDDECSVLLSYVTNATAFLHASITTDTNTTCIIYGTKGSIHIPSRFHEQEEYHILDSANETQTIKVDKTGIGFYHEIEHFNFCLNHNIIESPIMTKKMSLDLVGIMDTIRKQIGVSYIWDK